MEEQWQEWEEKNKMESKGRTRKKKRENRGRRGRKRRMVGNVLEKNGEGRRKAKQERKEELKINILALVQLVVLV